MGKSVFSYHPSPITYHFFSYPMHCVEEVFALRVDADAEAVACVAKTILERGGGFFGARHVGDDNHGELALHHRLIDVNDAAIGFGQNLRDSGDDARVVNAKHGDDQTPG